MRDPLINKQIDHYFIQERLQSGGMAVVYKAFDQKRQQIVAFKVLKDNFFPSPVLSLRFKREADIAKLLNHPHIVPFYEYGEHEGVFYIVMKLMEGGSLTNRFSRMANVPLGKSVHWLRQIASALDFSHRENVIHRDIKPGNILLANDDDAYLSDFGIARVVDLTTLMNAGEQMPGTLRHMSPEQANNNPFIDYRSDIYSFGVTAYLLATGRYPFTGENDLVILLQHAEDIPPLPTDVNPNLPPAIDTVLMRCLEKAPERRYNSASEFVSAFAQAIDGFEDLMVIVDPNAMNPLSSSRSNRERPTIVLESPVPDKTILANPLLWMGGLVVILVGMLIGMRLAGGDGPNGTATHVVATSGTPTASIMMVVTDIATALPASFATATTTATATDIPTNAPSAVPTLSETEVEATVQAEMNAILTDSVIVTATLDAHGIAESRLTQTQQALDAQTTQNALAMQTEQAQQMTRIAASWTNTPTPTPTPILNGYPGGNPVTANHEWVPNGQNFDGVEMVLVPIGSFLMGSTEGEVTQAVQLCGVSDREGDCTTSDWFMDEAPTSLQSFDVPFWIDRYEVTRAMYAACVAAGVCAAAPNSAYAELDSQPITRVTWFQAREYCQWRGGRLPTEAEWEYAARGPDRTLYAWGDTITGSEGNHCDRNCGETAWGSGLRWVSTEHDDGYAITAPVGSYPNGVSWVGAYDLSGNVLEWTNSIDQPYPYQANDGREDSANSDSPRVLRGGGFNWPDTSLRAAYREGLSPSFEHFSFGFRCARDYEQP